MLQDPGNSKKVIFMEPEEYIKRYRLDTGDIGELVPQSTTPTAASSPTAPVPRVAFAPQGTLAPAPASFAKTTKRVDGYTAEGGPTTPIQKTTAKLAERYGYNPGRGNLKDVWEEADFVGTASNRWTPDYIKSASKEEKKLIAEWAETVAKEDLIVPFPSIRANRISNQASPEELIDIYRALDRPINPDMMKKSIETWANWPVLNSEAAILQIRDGAMFDYQAWKKEKFLQIYRTLMGLPESVPSTKIPGEVPLF